MSKSCSEYLFTFPSESWLCICDVALRLWCSRVVIRRAKGFREQLLSTLRVTQYRTFSGQIGK